MDTLSAEELSSQSGCSRSSIDGFVRDGLIAPQDGHFVEGDIFRVRLIVALLQAGVRLDDLARLVGQGLLSFDFAGKLMAQPVALADETVQHTLDRLALQPAFVERLRMAGGQQAVPQDGRYRRDDMEILEIVAGARAMGLGDETLVSVYQLLAQSLRRTVDGMRDLFRDSVEQQLLREGLSHVDMMNRGAAIRAEMQAAGLRLSHLLQHRFLEEAVFDNVVLRVQQVLRQAGMSVAAESNEWTVAFCDLSGFTRLVHDFGDAHGGAMAMRLEQLAQSCATRHDGRLIKALGDGVLLLFRHATDAVAACDALIGAARDQDLLPVRTALASGPLIQRDGDIYGHTVNMAARLLGFAESGAMIADESTKQRLQHNKRFGLVDARDVVPKGLQSPLGIYRVQRK